MQFTIKFFPEITIKGKPVRRRFVNQLADNLRGILREVSPAIELSREWDQLTLRCPDDGGLRERINDELGRVPGISWYLEVNEYPLGGLDDIAERAVADCGAEVAGRRFAVRCKRAGKHEFTSIEVERHVGRALNQRADTKGVDLKDPEAVAHLEIRDDRLFIVKRRHRGLGGFPLGALDPVFSLISGGFDSTVASYLAMKRGMLAHFCFFSLGGRDHELGVKEAALFLWLKYGRSHPVHFVTVPFEEVVAELLRRVADPLMGVILKRMMLRAASQLAARLKLPALMTGESVAQVSSQTLANLALIDEAAERFVLRPLIAMDKEDIIRTAARIGTEPLSAAMPEYCGVISANPATRAKPRRVLAEEARFDMVVLERAIAAARVEDIRALAGAAAGEGAEAGAGEAALAGAAHAAHAGGKAPRPDIEVLPAPLAEAAIIDIRHPAEEERRPLEARGEVLKIPFYELQARIAGLDRKRTYLLYCGRGAMSALHAGHLIGQGYDNIKVYRPPPP